MILLDLGVGAVFFALGLILAFSKSAKGSTFVAFLLGFVGGGGGISVLGGGHIAILEGASASSPYVSNLGALLLSIGGGTALGLILGLTGKYLAARHGVLIDIAVVQEPVDPKDKSR